MKKPSIFKLGLALAIAGSSAAVVADQIDGTATANVLTPLTVSETTALDFGDIYGGSTPGTVVITSGGGVSATGGAGFVAASSPTPATFDISGAGTTNIIVSVDATGAQLDVPLGGTPMGLAVSPGALPTQTAADGTASFNVGATLSVGTNQPVGLYSTTSPGVPYTVTVNYQ